jgi:1,4-alpha-glucan branching enzyme
MGAELAAETEWSEERGLDWSARDQPEVAAVWRLLRDLNRAYRGLPALWQRDAEPDGFGWIVPDDADGNVIAFLRYAADGSAVAAVTNFAGVPHENYLIGLPYAGPWSELLNTDAAEYGGAGVGNLGAVTAVPAPARGFAHSATVQIGAFATIWLKAAR